ncbi:hypothetical protein J2W42_003002 [Rhizobium tibeticum]|uniref:hypothetical protein n=1 Tax=Rhizobium tibeticum TaxID=501024 RepID=UPI002785615B|nr:hypothetical protein [Rhizobium tibeticum]MDP9810141.1 hypothetical protein [Rhizobium tibeticum]
MLDPVIKKPDSHSILERLKIKHLYLLAEAPVAFEPLAPTVLTLATGLAIQD